MRVLLYNWVPAGSPITEGGGVALYVKNLVDGFSRAGHQVSVLSSGFRYSILGSKLGIVERKSDRSNVKYFDVLNSPVAAPSFFMFQSVSTMLDCPELVELMARFLERQGPFDVVHIQNVEGISFDVLTLADRFPGTKFLLTNHNYHLVCQQANLWHQDKERCTTYREGARCHTCNVFPVNMDELVVDRFMRFHGWGTKPTRAAKLYRRLLHRLVAARRKLVGSTPWDLRDIGRYKGRRIGPADLYQRRRHDALDLVNRHCARVLSVSRATEDVLLTYGLDPQVSEVRYIGTSHYDAARPRPVKAARPELRLAFLGYTRPDKGFQFLASAIENMPSRLKGCFALHIAARISDPEAVQKIQARASAFAELTIQDGYAQSDLESLLQEVDLGLVLPLWDDALPQVAIEFVCHGVPILVSNRGGQQELAGDAAFVFDPENVTDFWDKLERLWLDRGELERFWTLPRPLKTNADHVAELLEVYQQA